MQFAIMKNVIPPFSINCRQIIIRNEAVGKRTLGATTFDKGMLRF